MKKRRGSVLISIIVALGIILIILPVIVPFLKKSFFMKKEMTVEEEEQIYTVKGKGEIDNDLLHAGLGMPCRYDKCPVLPFTWDGKEIIIRYEKDPDDEPRYAVADCSSSSCAIVESNYEEKLSTTAVDSDRENCRYIGNLAVKTGDVIPLPPGLTSDVYVFFGVKSKYNGCSAEGLPVSFPCVKVAYFLKNDPACPAGTKDLVRETPGGEEVVYPCVSDYKVLVDYDTNGDGEIEDSETLQEKTITTLTDLNKLRNVKLFVLYTTGQKIGTKVNPYFKNGIPYFRIVINGKEILLKLPQNYQGYSWKIAINSSPLENLILRSNK